MFNFHTHKWEVKNCIQGTLEKINTKAIKEITCVLYKCECGKFKTENLLGLWKLEDFKGD